MRTKPFKSYSHSTANTQKESMVFSSIDNRATLTRTFKSIQPDKKLSSLTTSVSKENRNSHAFITSAYDQQVISQPLHPQQQPRHYKHIPQTFTTNLNHERVLPQTNRPTMGGKTISAIHHLPANTVIRSPNLMSSQELKLLSRRINPREPLSSPHASPTKPPLPNINLQSRRKRARQYQLQREQIKAFKVEHIVEEVEVVEAVEAEEATVTTTATSTQQQFLCEPCNKKYKTRNGLNYHLERCKAITKKPSAIIQCVCSNPTDDTTTMIECIQCNTWLHLKCAGDSFTNESSYCCPRCVTSSSLVEIKQEPVEQVLESAGEHEQEEESDHLLQNGITVKLAELCQAKERGKNLLQQFKQVDSQEIEKPIRNEFNFISLFSDESTVFTSSEEQLWDQTPTVEEEFSWSIATETAAAMPSLLFDDNQQQPSSFIDEASSILSPQSDWLHFANFEVDFTAATQEEEEE